MCSNWSKVMFPDSSGIALIKSSVTSSPVRSVHSCRSKMRKSTTLTDSVLLLPSRKYRGYSTKEGGGELQGGGPRAPRCLARHRQQGTREGSLRASGSII
eukprot:CAMPEP_0206120844 /NCGR_PEP_ID=MMETSP1472-20131121/955_1 /ASSEMBLY_ACC=CAM_ASM_001108 /TAXON_ID=41880 /ORGANISM="Pycnococcus provasolii, Strain RCC251" /LENGTH=99 /DNA_ID=CAMNT_0053511073 /DNA_START=56 /DNA_END=355 /DNA_ORIENTATION=+